MGLSYEEFVDSDLANMIEERTKLRVEKAKSENKKKINLELSIKENGVIRDLTDEEIKLMIELLKNKGYIFFEGELDVQPGMIIKRRFGRKVRDYMKFTWLTQEELEQNKKVMRRFYIIIAVAVILILLGQASIYGWI